MGNSSASPSTSTQEPRTSFNQHSQDQEKPHERRVRGLAKLLALEHHDVKSHTTISRAQQQLLPENVVQERQQVEATRNASRTIKHLFKQLDPSVMTVTAQSRGEIQLALKAKPESNTLLVKVIQCKNLNPKDLRGSSADPYVKLMLSSKTAEHEQRKTRYVTKTLHPVFNELFSFDLQEASSDHTKLIVQVWDKDLISEHDFMGEALIALSDLDLRQETKTEWYPLQMETDLGISGDLCVRLTYRMPQTLQVTLVSASGLSPRDTDTRADPYVKLSVPGIPTVYETSVCKNTLNPVWEEAFEFPVAVTEFKEKYIVFHVIDQDRTGGNESLGQVILDLDNFDPKVGYEGNFALADLRNHPRLRSRWERHALVQEFRTALVAHAVARAPDLVFKSANPHKILSVRSRKAGTQARVHVMDGVPVF